MRVSKDIAILIISIVNNGEFLEIIQEQEGDKIDMCVLLDTIRQEGKIEGRISLFIDLLKTKFSPLSQEIVVTIENSNFEQLESLKTHFYKLNKQEDIMRILNIDKND